MSAARGVVKRRVAWRIEVLFTADWGDERVNRMTTRLTNHWEGYFPFSEKDRGEDDGTVILKANEIVSRIPGLKSRPLLLLPDRAARKPPVSAPS